VSELSDRPRRSVLYMPAANARALDKAREIPADALIFDLEDAVAPDAKDLARDQATAAVRDGGYGSRELIIRANGPDTPWHRDDVAAIAAAGPAAVLVPKVEHREQVVALDDALTAHGAPATTAIWAMLETPIAVFHAREIAEASSRLAVLVMGTNDLTKELRARRVPDRTPLLGALASCVLAARATGCVILDGVYNDVADAPGFAAECRQGRDLGFDGKTLIHPSQVGPCNEAFSPTPDEVVAAERIIAAFEEAARDGRGVVTVDGRMVENLHVDEARRVLAVQAALAALA
jgi:citrate lyase subunit beta / citryl-CoA lyase